MPKRLVWFLLLLVTMLGINIGLPILNRLSQENQSQNTSVSLASSGYQAFFRLCQAISREPVALWQHSLMFLPSQQKHTIWFMEPGKGLLFDGPRYAGQMRKLVNEGSHLIFVLDANTDDEEASYWDVLHHLERWYNITLDVQKEKLPDILPVNSYFASREIKSLRYQGIKVPARNGKLPIWKKDTQKQKPSLLVFKRLSPIDGAKATLTVGNKKPVILGYKPGRRAGDSKVLLETRSGQPLIYRFTIGKGSVTVVPNSFYFSNHQLNSGDNAPLAIAIAETNATGRTLFEVYSSGFNENRDILTYLAMGKGLTLLLSLLLFLILFCVGLIYEPIRKRNSRPSSDEHHFTQEVFIDSLASHYLQTGDWNGLYDKMSEQLRHEIEKKLPGLPFDAQLKRLANNPFYNVSLNDLQACFAKIEIGSQREFINRGKHLLHVQGKVNRYEQHASVWVSQSAAR